MIVQRSCGGKPSTQDKNEEDQKYYTESPARVITPASAVWPHGQCTQNHQDQNYQQYGIQASLH